MNAAIPMEGQGQRRGTALAMSVGLHALLVLLLFLLKIVTPIPPYPAGGGEGMEMGIADLGYSFEGMGDNESMEENAASSSETASQPDESNEDLITEEDGEEINTPPTDKPQPDKPATKPTNKPPKITEPTVNPNALFSPSKNPGSGTSQNGSGGDGSSNTPGNAGIPGGDPLGSGRGGWGDWRLSGRGLGKGPSITEKPNEDGKVVLNIWVDRAGKVLRVAQNLDMSTTTSQTLFNLAKKAALQCTFTPKPNAAAEQKGEMTFVFILE